MYRDGRATDEYIAQQAARIVSAYPTITPGFHSELLDAIKRKNMSAKQVEDCITRAIDNNKWANISEIINYDKTIRLYNYEEVCSNVSKHPFADYYVVVINGVGFRILKSDAEDARIKHGFNIEAFRNFVKQ